MTPSQVDIHVVQVRLRLIRDLLRDLHGVGDLTVERLTDDRLLQHAVQRILTQLVDLAVSVNSHLAAARLGRAPADYRESFALAAESGYLDKAVAERLAPSVGLRNVLVHEYVTVDLRLVVASVPEALEQYDAYVRSVAASLPVDPT